MAASDLPLCICVYEITDIFILRYFQNKMVALNGIIVSRSLVTKHVAAMT